MKRGLTTILALILSVNLCICGQAAFTPYSNKSLEQTLNEYKKQNKMDESNFAFAYYNTVTGETYFDNADKWMTGGSTYKFPLNLYLYDLQNKGELSPNTIINGQKLSSLQYKSIVYSDNQASESLLKYVGYNNFKVAISQWSDVTEPPEFYYKNIFSPHFMLDLLKKLYYNKQDFKRLHSHMLITSPNKALKKYVKEYKIAYKTGTYEGAYNSVGIVYSPTPYLIAVYTQGYDYDHVGEINRLVCDYTVYANRAIKANLDLIKVTVDGNENYILGSNIDSNIYLSLRTVADLLKDTQNCIGVGWDGKNITLETGAQYVKDENTYDLEQAEYAATVSFQTILLDNKPIYIKKYLIAGTTFIKLRDFTNLTGVDIDWDNGVIINTKKGENK